MTLSIYGRPIAVAALFMLALSFTYPAPAAAEQADASTQQQSSQDERDDEKLDEVLRKFGYISGQAWQHIPAADRPKFERHTMNFSNNIVRLFGSDRAFLFAAAFGAGTAQPIDAEKGAAALKQYETMRIALRALSEME